VQTGVITGFHADVDPKAASIGLQAIISVRLTRHSRENLQRFHRYVLTVPEVRALYHIGGVMDFMIHVAVRDADHLRDLTLTTFTTRPEVDHLQTSIIFEYQRIPALSLGTNQARSTRASRTR
jgi:DNA-binding Lrp family transcriptional regulator